MKAIKYIMRTRRFQWLWENLLAVALYGMNMGPIDIKTNGEERLIERLAQQFPKDAVLFDVGANKGDYTLALLRHFGRDARIFAFEPSKPTFELLSGAISSGRNVRMEQMGFGERGELMNLYADAQGSALASLYQRRIFGNQLSVEAPAEKIHIMRVDDYCHANDIERINLLKVDVEGHELSVLKGCGDLLAQKIDVIQFEFGGCNIDSRTYLKDFFDMLAPEYELFRMVADGLVSLKTYRESYEIFVTNNIVAARDPLLLAGLY
jgi:FkbM family methyltransferase